MVDGGISPAEEDILDFAKVQHFYGLSEQSVNAFQSGTGSLDDALLAFKNFITYCTADKRWFFRDGEPLKLPRDTQSIRLLPPINGMSPHERLVICVYPAADKEPAALQLLHWMRDGHPSVIRLLDTPHPIDFGDMDEQPPLNELPHRVELQQRRSGGHTRTFVVTLTYRSGQVELTANERGIRDAYWVSSETPETKREERSSCGDDMRAVLGITEAVGDEWRDDVLFDEYRKCPVPHRTSGEWGIPTGRIKGADSSNDTDDAGIWFCNNLARVWFWHPNTGLLKSETLGGEVYAVLRIPTPQHYARHSESVVVASSGDGRIYLLGKQKPDVKGEGLIVVYGYQSISQHIMRVIGDGRADILAVDINQTVYPIHVGVEDFVDNLRTWASALSLLRFRINGFEFTAGIADIHLPIDTALLAIHIG